CHAGRVERRSGTLDGLGSPGTSDKTTGSRFPGQNGAVDRRLDADASASCMVKARIARRLPYAITLRKAHSCRANYRPRADRVTDATGTPRMSSLGSTTVGEQLGQVHRLYAGKVVELRTAREAIREDDRLRRGLPYGGPQLMLCNGDRHLGVPLLDAEVAREPTASAQALHGGSGTFEQGRVRTPAEHRGVVAVRLRHDLGARQGGWRPVVRSEE